MTVIGTIHAYGEALSVVEHPLGQGRFAYACYSQEGEPYGTLSKNVPGAPLAEGEVLVKTYSENEPFRQPLLDSGLFEDTGKRILSGFIELEVWRRKH